MSTLPEYAVTRAAATTALLGTPAAAVAPIIGQAAATATGQAVLGKRLRAAIAAPSPDTMKLARLVMLHIDASMALVEVAPWEDPRVTEGIKGVDWLAWTHRPNLVFVNWKLIHSFDVYGQLASLYSVMHHEIIHLRQFRTGGRPKSLRAMARFEKHAYKKGAKWTASSLRVLLRSELPPADIAEVTKKVAEIGFVDSFLVLSKVFARDLAHVSGMQPAAADQELLRLWTTDRTVQVKIGGKTVSKNTGLLLPDPKHISALSDTATPDELLKHLYGD